MSAARWLQKQVADLEPGPGEIRIRVSGCGVCHTDLHTVEGELELPRLPLVPGHQIVGITERAGSGASPFAIGDRVGVPWLGSTCGRCGYAPPQRRTLCASAAFNSLHTDGGYAEAAVALQDFALPRPARLSRIEAAPLLVRGHHRLSRAAPF